jgi:thiamine-monophosphate kinase
MNGVPTQITVSIGISNRFSVEALEELYKGIHLACNIYNVDLVGGDTTSSNKGLIISITAIGRADKGRVSYRSGAMPGDAICVTGNLGAAYLGLQILEREKQIYLDHPDVQPELEDHEMLIGRLLKPEARRDAVAYFEQKGIVPTSMIDISDGLSSEALHICRQSGVGMIIEEGKVPIHPETEKLAIEFKINPITCAMHGGEDYELMFTVSDNDLEDVRYMDDVYIVGEVTAAEQGLKLLTTGGKIVDLNAQGWNHFKP